MKKLKLNLQQFEGAEVLTRSQLKQILGGDGGSGAGCDNVACAKKSSDTLGLCACSEGGQCLCVK